MGAVKAIRIASELHAYTSLFTYFETLILVGRIDSFAVVSFKVKKKKNISTVVIYTPNINGALPDKSFDHGGTLIPIIPFDVSEWFDLDTLSDSIQKKVPIICEENDDVIREIKSITFESMF